MVDTLQVKLRYAAYAEAGGVTTIDAADAAQIVELCEMAERAATALRWFAQWPEWVPDTRVIDAVVRDVRGAHDALRSAGAGLRRGDCQPKGDVR